MDDVNNNTPDAFQSLWIIIIIFLKLVARGNVV